MNKHINSFNTLSDYNTAYGNILLPSVSYIKATKKLIYEIEYTADKTLAQPGWIAYNNNGITEYYNPKSTQISSLVSSNIIGIVVIPATHTDDGTVRVVSLDYMDYNNPTTGSVSSVDMCWGGSGSGVPNLTSCDKIVSYVTGTTTTSLSGSAKVPTNYDMSWYSGSTVLSDNNNEYLFIGTTSYGFSYNATPCPYDEDNTPNAVYHTFSGSILSQGLCGSENTDKIIAVATHSGSIANNSSTGYYPVAECCRAYKDGSWYLPALAELGYLCAKLKEIEYARTVLERGTLTGKYYWSSSLNSYYNAWYLNLSLDDFFGLCGNSSKGNGRSVLAFVAL